MAATAVIASALGGYISGRLRTRWLATPGDEVFFRDTAHGLLSWALATVMGAAFLATAATAVSGGVAAGAGQAAAAQQGPIRRASARSPVPAQLCRAHRRHRPSCSCRCLRRRSRPCGRPRGRRPHVVCRPRAARRARRPTTGSISYRWWLPVPAWRRPTQSVVSPLSRRMPAPPLKPLVRSACDSRSGSSRRCSSARSRRQPRCPRGRNAARPSFLALSFHPQPRRFPMGRSILLWLLGVPIPLIIILLALFWR